MRRRDGIILNSIKRETLSVSYNNQVLEGVVSRLIPHALSKTRPSFLLYVGQEENILGHSQICFERRQGIPYPNSKSRKKMVNKLLMVIITHICKRSLILCKGKNWKLDFYLQQPENILKLNSQHFGQQIDKKIIHY